MRNPLRRHHERERDTNPVKRPSEATAARIKAERDLEIIRAATPVYRDLGDRLRHVRERNNFAAAFKHSFQGGRHA